MMCKIKTVDDCKTASDFERLALKREREGKCCVENGGSHLKVKVPGKGAMPIKRSNKNSQLSGYLLKAMQKQWKALGLAVFLLFVVCNFVI